MTTTEMLERLKKYQELLSERVALEEEIATLPKTLETQNEMLSRIKKSFMEKDEEFKRVEEKVHELRQALQEAEMSRERAEQQMDGITTQREYEAINKEIRDATDKEQALRKDIQQEERVFSEIEEELRKNAGTIEQLEIEIAEKTKVIDSQKSEKLQTIDQLKQQEAEVSQDISKEILFKLERIIRNKKGVGVVPVHGVVCSGCHMILPANFVNEIRDSESNTVHFCPYCSRILFYEEVKDEAGFLGDIESGALADLAFDTEDEEEEAEDEDVAESEEIEKPKASKKKTSKKKAVIADDFLMDQED